MPKLAFIPDTTFHVAWSDPKTKSILRSCELSMEKCKVHKVLRIQILDTVFVLPLDPGYSEFRIQDQTHSAESLTI